MALVTISGHPCSGKTRRAEQLRDRLLQRMKDAPEGPQLKVVLISDHALNIERDVYADGRKEKPARAALFTSLQRQIGRDTILIVDGMNYIKGYRYQIYCAAREQRVRVSTLYVVAPTEQCRAWNTERKEKGEDSYAPEVLDNLIQRYEEPSSMVRWDSPLFTVLPEDELPVDDIWQAITEGAVKPPNAGTTAAPKAPADALHTLESTATAMVQALMAEQAANEGLGLGGSLTLTLAHDVKPALTLPHRIITLSELQRHKRQFVTVHKKAITLGTTEKGAVDWSESSVADKFSRYLEENLKP